MTPTTEGASRVLDGSRILWMAVFAGAVLGVAVVHPMTMVGYWFEFPPVFTGISSAGDYVASRMWAGFSPSMWPMTGIFAVGGAGFGLATGWAMRSLLQRQRQIDEQRRELKALRELLPICAWCTKVRDDQGYWQRVEAYLADRDIAQFTHCLCPDCAARLVADSAEMSAEGGAKVGAGLVNESVGSAGAQDAAERPALPGTRSPEG